MALTTVGLVVQGCGTKSAPRSWPGSYAGISSVAMFVAVQGELLTVTPVGTAVQISSLSEGKVQRESTITVRGEVLGLRVAPSGGRLWVGIESCEGKVVRDDLVFCDGTSNVSVYAGAPDDQQLVADVTKNATATTTVERLQAMVAHREGVVVTVSPKAARSAADVSRYTVTDGDMASIPGDGSLGELCSSKGELY